MRRKIYLLCLLTCLCAFAGARDITFCGERIPFENPAVAKKLMDVIRSQVRNVDLASLRRESRRYFPMIEYLLKRCNMPDDLKYIPIVESGFTNATSTAGARGFWQLMPETATGFGLKVNEAIDERTDIYKATIVALRKLASDFTLMRSQKNVASWVLTAAAYNWGIGRVCRKIDRGSTDYFAMQLNPETAVYVYKIVAIKELFEYPELYLKNFQYNVFSRTKTYVSEPNPGLRDFETMKLGVNKDAAAPNDELIKNTARPTEGELEKERKARVKAAKLVGAQIEGKYPDFKDGDSIVVKLNEDLQTLNGFQRKDTRITGKGWIIDDRVFVDLGFATNNVILYDANSEQGVALPDLKNKKQVILRVQN